MYDLITIGNVSVDMYFAGDSLTKSGDRFTLALGGKYMVDHFYECLGGGAANVAIGAKKAGLKTAIKGVIGDNQFKHLTLEHLKSHDISTTLCRIEKGYQKISTILLSSSGERTVINYETPHEHILGNNDALVDLEHTKAIYMSNLWRVALEERKKVLSHLFHANILTVVNLGVADCRRTPEQIHALLEHVKILIVNTHEFAELVKKPIDAIDFKENVTKHIPYLKAKLIIITNGKRGSYAYQNDQVLHVPALHVERVMDTTGAGDGYSAGFIASYLKDQEVKSAMEAGNKYAAHILQKIGAN